jgi:hypothetical protein
MNFFQAAQGVILALYNLNRPEFTLMLTALPPTYQVIISFFVFANFEINYSFLGCGC